MLCPSCGNPVQGAFCSHCGTRVLAPPPAPPPPLYGPPPIRFIPRVERHVHPLGVLWCVYGIYRAATGIFAVLFFLGLSSRGPFGPFGAVRIFPFIPYNPWMRPAASFLAVIVLLGAAASFTVGFSLLRRKPWGRTLAIILGILVLIRIPLGTALGIYTLSVLAPSASGEEYAALADYT
jgi:hypothetical protein